MVEYEIYLSHATIKISQVDEHSVTKGREIFLHGLSMPKCELPSSKLNMYVPLLSTLWLILKASENP